ncbi:hypothetical protein [Streptomyces sp. NPDC059909]|uniref:hypothetical protein n=1 Tax=Streptomyces sp. NPDC059909 TaxID=3346998 RepID=UPI00364F9EA6
MSRSYAEPIAQMGVETGLHVLRRQPGDELRRTVQMLHVKDQVLTPAQVSATVAAYRSVGTAFGDTVPAGR